VLLKKALGEREEVSKSTLRKCLFHSSRERGRFHPRGPIHGPQGGGGGSKSAWVPGRVTLLRLRCGKMKSEKNKSSRTSSGGHTFCAFNFWTLTGTQLRRDKNVWARRSSALCLKRYSPRKVESGRSELLGQK